MSPPICEVCYDDNRLGTLGTRFPQTLSVDASAAAFANVSEFLPHASIGWVIIVALEEWLHSAGSAFFTHKSLRKGLTRQLPMQPRMNKMKEQYGHTVSIVCSADRASSLFS